LSEISTCPNTPGELTGAAYQGTVFGYLRADASHLQVDVAKVRTGSKRVGRIGDIDARGGELLVLSAEVKQYTLLQADVPAFEQFSSQVSDQGALGLVVALDFEEGARVALRKLQLEPMSIDDLIERVRLCDALKQAIAVRALLYYVHYIEKSSALYKRLREFLDSLESTRDGCGPGRWRRGILDNILSTRWSEVNCIGAMSSTSGIGRDRHFSQHWGGLEEMLQHVEQKQFPKSTLRVTLAKFLRSHRLDVDTAFCTSFPRALSSSSKSFVYFFLA
jgi:hypothetical protein